PDEKEERFMPTVLLHVDQYVARLLLTSPPANALSSRLLRDLNDALSEIEKHDTVKVVLLQGEGKFFSAGADIKEFTRLQEATEFEELGRFGQEVFQRMERFPVPIIAVIHGAALGGGLELAMSCQMRIVTE